MSDDRGQVTEATVDLSRLAAEGRTDELAVALGYDEGYEFSKEELEKIIATTDAPAPEPEAAEERKAAFDAGEVLRSPAFHLGVVFAVGLGLFFWPLIQFLPKLWGSADGYFSHGYLIPAISGYIVYKWWPRLRTIPVRPSWLALVLLLGVLWVSKIAVYASIDAIMSLGFLATVLLGIAFVAGWRWMAALTLPTLYLAFAMPLWTMAIDTYTNPLQRYSTKVAFALLQVFGFEPFRENETTIMLNHFTLDVGVPCSGLKLVLALAAFTAFFVLIANLRWWGNVLMVAFLLPLALFINGLRIMLIGVVGDMYGSEAGHKFHDYSGYITLIVCFFVLFKIARWLGWKD